MEEGQHEWNLHELVRWSNHCATGRIKWATIPSRSAETPLHFLGRKDEFFKNPTPLHYVPFHLQWVLSVDQPCLAKVGCESSLVEFGQNCSAEMTQGRNKWYQSVTRISVRDCRSFTIVGWSWLLLGPGSWLLLHVFAFFALYTNMVHEKSVVTKKYTYRKNIWPATQSSNMTATAVQGSSEALLGSNHWPLLGEDLSLNL